ncbi:M48 family metalloprotease [Undibacterium sp. CY18W]|uniref:M48 family metalloprotease n=1 Tax=Undibacterium hunanense TaxID=2762292 RepID=A0ABR6ZKK9_9BURK|nr:M48 family metalloprotease [Undibacterium hunanense]MBC3916429.1 M48 family metalloprotease [Undibacterium hunanense]
MRALQKFAVACLALALSGSATAQFDFLNKAIDAAKSKIGPAGNLLDKAKPVVDSMGIDEPKEVEIGNEFAAVLLGAKPLLNDPPLQRYVNTLGRWLASQTERPDLPWTFGVLDDVGFNAFATPGGKIFVTKGLLMRMRTESELVGVLSHEIAHVVLKHHVNAMQSKAWTDFGGEAASSYIAKGNLAEYKGKLVNLGKEMYTKGLDKGDEYAADSAGVVIAARAGFDPYGLPAVLQTLQAQSAQDNNFSLLFETHPSPTDRLESLSKSMNGRFDSSNGSVGKSFAERSKEFSR